MVHEMLKTLEKLALPLKLVLLLGMDGPNVNKFNLGKLDEKKKEKGFKPLARCPVSCLIHLCHNSFCKGVNQYGDNAEELCMNLFNLFKNNPCRKQDLLFLLKKCFFLPKSHHDPCYSQDKSLEKYN